MSELKTKVLSTLKSKKGTVIEEGTQVTVTYLKDEDYLKIETFDGRIIKIRPMYANKKLRGFKKTPSDKTLAKWNGDGIAKSIKGNTVEPDGYDEYGMPSWFLALGMI